MTAILKTSVVQNASSSTANITLDTSGGASIGNGVIASPSTMSLQTNGSTTGLYIDASQNVGIGTTSPGGKLHVSGGRSYFTANSEQYDVALKYNSATTGVWLGSPGTDSFTVSTEAGTERMRIDSSGSVGIGTSSPGAKLHVSGGNTISSNYYFGTATSSAGTVGSDTGAAGAKIVFYGTASGGSGTLDLWSGGIAPIQFNTGGSERMRIDSSGNLLVGTTTSAAKLTVSGGLNVGTVNTATGDQSSLSANSGASVLGINTVGTGSQTMIRFLTGNNANLAGSVTTNTTTTAYNTSSDYRLKENVQPMRTGLATIGALKPVTYDWINNKSAGEGFIAHELQAVIPHAVTGEKDAVDADGKIIPQGVDYSKIVVHLVAAIQELKATVDAQAAEITALKAKVGA